MLTSAYKFRHALVIGTNYGTVSASAPGSRMERAGLEPLLYAEADALELVEKFEDDGYLVESLIGARATRANIVPLLESYRDTTASDQLLIVYFSGHGVIGLDGRPYLLPIDFDIQRLSVTAIPLEDIVARHLTASHEYNIGTVVVLLDCCYSGRVLVEPHADNTPRRLSAAQVLAATATHIPGNIPGRVVLTACGQNEKTREYPWMRHGAFTFYFLEYWQSQSEVDLDPLYNYIARGLRRNDIPLPMRGGLQQGVIILRSSDGEILDSEVPQEVSMPDEDSPNLDTSSHSDYDDDPELAELKKWGGDILAKLIPSFQQLMKSGNINDRIALGERILTLEPGHEPTRQQVFQTRIDRGKAYLQQNNVEAAVVDFTRASELDSRDAAAYFYRGIATARTGRAQQAVQDFIRATELDNANPEYFYHLARSEAALEDYASAVQHFKRAISIDPTGSGGYYLELGQAYQQMNTPRALDAAELSYRNAIALDAPGADNALTELRKIRSAT